MEKEVSVKIDPETLNLIMSPAELQEIIDGQCKKSFREGMKRGIETERNRPKPVPKSPKFDPKKHVDKSLYAYTTLDGLAHLNNENGKVIMARRPEGMAKDPSKTVFCKITPLENEVKHD